MSYYRSIVCDVDDTIMFTTNRDWENAKPNIRLIDKLNKLHSEGWEIRFFTARGTLSCNGDRQLADETYRPFIEKWLKKHNVKYNDLSFNKPLAAYYIDDKGITPEDFLNLDIEVMHGGISGAIIERRGDKVYKTHKNSLESARWYNEAKNIIKTINVHSVIGETICMDYIEPTDDPKIEQIDYIINKFRSVPAYTPFNTYIKRIADHLELIEEDYKQNILDSLYKNEGLFNSEASFCHGDMSLDNMINSNDVLYLIDPNKPEGLYSSWLLDVSKVLHSARRFDKPLIYDYFFRKYNKYGKQLLILECTHWIRMIKYQKEANPENVQNIHDIINTILRDINAWTDF